MEDVMKNEIIEIISNLTKISKEEIDSKEAFVNAGIDSFSVVEIVYAIENKYEIDIPQDSLLGVQNVDDLVALVKKLVENRG
jgi:acyl carrier protein